MNALSLKARAVNFLSRREYSRAELAKKLAQPTISSLRRTARSGEIQPPSEQDIQAVLDDLQRQGFLNDVRFAQSLVHRKASKFGASRLLHELSQHNLSPETQQCLSDELKSSELARCYDAWQTKFLHVSKDRMDNDDFVVIQAQKAKETRFLLQRGFSMDAVRQVMKGWRPDSEL